MVLLMQKYTNGDTIGVEDLTRWPSDSNVVDFLSMITSVTSFHELTTVSLYSSPGEKPSKRTSMHYLRVIGKINRLVGW